MPFRQKAKNLFKSSRPRNSSSSSNTTDTSSSNHDVYKPGEAMPPPKYRRPAAKEHTEKLESFSFADAWRKRSFQSSHSPMGTCAHNSRRASVVSNLAGMGRRRSGLNSSAVAAAAAAAAAQDEEEGRASVVTATGGASTLPTERDEGVEDEVVNDNMALHKTLSTAHDHQPFSEQDLANALSRSRMQVSAH